MFAGNKRLYFAGQSNRNLPSFSEHYKCFIKEKKTHKRLKDMLLWKS